MYSGAASAGGRCAGGGRHTSTRITRIHGTWNPKHRCAPLLRNRPTCRERGKRKRLAASCGRPSAGEEERHRISHKPHNVPPWGCIAQRPTHRSQGERKYDKRNCNRKTNATPPCIVAIQQEEQKLAKDAQLKLQEEARCYVGLPILWTPARRSSVVEAEVTNLEFFFN